MSFAVTSTRAKSVPTAIDEVTTQRWLFRLADPYDYSSAGITPKQAPAPVPGRCVPVGTRLQTHVATPSCPLEEAVDRVAAGRPLKGLGDRTAAGVRPGP
jgi:S-DNA-T family DNA segregation ATPase FtsK/SpoIIIE